MSNTDLMIINGSTLLAIGFIWLFAPMLLPLILLFGAVIIGGASFVFYVIALWKWINRG